MNKLLEQTHSISRVNPHWIPSCPFILNERLTKLRINQFTKPILNGSAFSAIEWFVVSSSEPEQTGRVASPFLSFGKPEMIWFILFLISSKCWSCSTPLCSRLSCTDARRLLLYFFPLIAPGLFFRICNSSAIMECNLGSLSMFPPGLSWYKPENTLKTSPINSLSHVSVSLSSIWTDF